MTTYRVKLFRQLTTCTPVSALVGEYTVEGAPDAEEAKRMAIEAGRGRGLVVDSAEIAGPVVSNKPQGSR